MRRWVTHDSRVCSRQRAPTARGLLALALCVSLAACGYSQADFDTAYNDGYRAGIIWCKRVGDPVVPALEVELLEHWQRGWRESTLAQCETEAQRVPLDALTPS